jgi:hypothetical protein
MGLWSHVDTVQSGSGRCGHRWKLDCEIDIPSGHGHTLCKRPSGKRVTVGSGWEV